mmetsp:Transcript_21312/g.37878  ORF Transcript_21312/g.37878 Transcript_21312/m.37878 type:complete len:218 (-) Transcript_21312:150-803(-)
MYGASSCSGSNKSSLSASASESSLASHSHSSSSTNSPNLNTQGRLVYVFLHVDCILPQDFFQKLEVYWAQNDVQIAVCRVRFTRNGIAMRVFELMASIESVFTSFGDQGIVVTHHLYNKLKGFPSMMLMEDVQFLRNARKIAKIHTLPVTISVSARKFDDRGPLTYMVQCIVILSLYIFAGLSVDRCAHLYKNPTFLRGGLIGLCVVVFAMWFMLFL